MFLSVYLKEESLSVRAFAAKCGLSPSGLSRIINGHRFPSPETMYRIHIETNGKVGADDFFRQRIGETDG